MKHENNNKITNSSNFFSTKLQNLEIVSPTKKELKLVGAQTGLTLFSGSNKASTCF